MAAVAAELQVRIDRPYSVREIVSNQTKAEIIGGDSGLALIPCLRRRIHRGGVNSAIRRGPVPEIDQADSAGMIYQYILRAQIAVKEAGMLQIAQSQLCLSG